MSWDLCVWVGGREGGGVNSDNGVLTVVWKYNLGNVCVCVCEREHMSDGVCECVSK